MSVSTLPLSYCTNVHPAQTVSEVVDGLDRYASAVRRELGRGLAAGLWLAAPVVEEIERDPEAVPRLKDALARGDLCCYTLNAFPYGDFHGDRVKEQVYIPDWSTDARREYSLRCARVLSVLLPEGVEGSLSTVPLGFKLLEQSEDFLERCTLQLIATARALDELHDDTGRVLRLAIEPEPLCVLETTAETLEFFERLRQRAAEVGSLEAVQRHLGVCYDVCHQAVEFEDVADSIAQLQQAEVRINKLHITNALRLEHPGENAAGRQALAAYAEPRYLHQTFARTAGGGVLRQLDLDAGWCAAPPEDFLSATEWRTHFHVPVDAEEIGPLKTTRPDLRAALEAVAALPYAPHLEVETYTWGVLPGGSKPGLVEGLTAELAATYELLQPLSPLPPGRPQRS